MNDDRLAERQVTALFEDAAPSHAPARLRTDIRGIPRSTRQRPRWIALIKESPMRVSNRVAVGSPMARLTISAAAGLALAVVLAGAVLGAASPSPSELTVGASPSPSLPPAGLVTEDVEPGVERIISDGAGHDLEEKHPTYRYDMDDVFVAPDGTVWLSTSYSDTDNDANPARWARVGARTARDGAVPRRRALCFRGDTRQPRALGRDVL